MEKPQPQTADPNPSSSNNNESSSAGDFECNICFELAQDPIVTLCGHLYCWPCIYRWLHHHSQSQECPVCKALIQEQKLVPLYGRGKSTSDPRSRPINTDESPIPNRPTGQRPQTAPPPPPHGPGPATDQNYFSNLGFGFLGGFMPMATARFGNMTMSAGFGGLFPSLMSFQFNGLSDGPMYGYPYGMHHPHGFHHHHHHHQTHQQQHHHNHGQGQGQGQGQDHLLKNLFLLVGFFVLLAFIWS